ncbi:MAG: hypothetical protein MNPFHGCM_00507 [Gemmatimonadaceae bacterium]|nr:hypothetical protein [Gemmatimonadaceae bacterium]
MSKLKVTAEPGSLQIVGTREFDAPRHLVFQVFTDPDLVPQWWGPREFVTTVEIMDPRPAGSWRFLHTLPDGTSYGFHGVYHDVVFPERIVYTFEFEEMPGHVLLETVTFQEIDGRTRLTFNSVFQSVEDRDGMVRSGMEDGAAASYDRLEELLKTRV